MTFPEGEGVRTTETNLGDFAADAILWQARQTLGEENVDAALTNGGGIREALAKGDISRRACWPSSLRQHRGHHRRDRR
ncbi:MAG: 5'-nucleotidase C-terminal domain-containing protein [Flavonifractor plautii]